MSLYQSVSCMLETRDQLNLTYCSCLIDSERLVNSNTASSSMHCVHASKLQNVSLRHRMFGTAYDVRLFFVSCHGQLQVTLDQFFFFSSCGVILKETMSPQIRTSAEKYIDFQCKISTNLCGLHLLISQKSKFPLLIYWRKINLFSSGKTDATGFPIFVEHISSGIYRLCLKFYKNAVSLQQNVFFLMFRVIELLAINIHEQKGCKCIMYDAKILNYLSQSPVYMQKKFAVVGRGIV